MREWDHGNICCMNIKIFQSNIFKHKEKMGLKYHIDPRFNYRQFS